VPSGLIHDWVGTAFIPNATLDDVLRVSRDYTHYKDIYKPVVIESSAARSSGARCFLVEADEQVTDLKNRARYNLPVLHPPA
jgi:hypothetical protein